MAKNKKDSKKRGKKRDPRRRGRLTKAQAERKVKSISPALVAEIARKPLGRCYATDGWKEEGSAVTICVSRALRSGKTGVAFFLVDLGCLGVKDAWVAKMDPTRFEVLLDRAEAPLFPCSSELAAKIVTSAVDYAADAGLAPHPSYVALSPIFEDVDVRKCDDEIPLGIDGKPFYMAMPRDDAGAILQRLTATLGPDGFHYVLPQPL